MQVSEEVLQLWQRRRDDAAKVPPIRLGPDEDSPQLAMLEVVKAAPHHVEIEQVMYHLHRGSLIGFHPEQKIDDVRFWACNSCESALKLKRTEPPPPQYSLKAGYDFGNLSALLGLGMPDLSLPELMLISPVRTMAILAKMMPTDGGGSSDATCQTGLKGHYLCTPHENVESLVNAKVLPNFEAVKRD